jgi:hypothetical protein
MRPKPHTYETILYLLIEAMPSADELERLTEEQIEFLRGSVKSLERLLLEEQQRRAEGTPR